MHMNVEVPVEASKQEIWRLITDIENAPSRISGIEELEVLESPADGLVGLKWRETRQFGGKTATETRAPPVPRYPRFGWVHSRYR